ncbi:C18orf8, partial [Thalictrum thalictroides]
MYGEGWTFLVPDLICDAVHGNLWRVHLDLEAISSSSSEAPSVLEFLQRRKLEPSKAKLLCLAATRTLILERRHVAMVSRAIDVLVSSYSHSLKMGLPPQKRAVEGEETSASSHQHFDGSRTVADDDMSRVEKNGNPNKPAFVNKMEKESQQSMFEDTVNEPIDLTTGGCNISGQQEAQVASAAVSSDEMYNLVFSLIEEEMTGEPAYLVSIIVEYFRSAASEKVKIHPNLNVMTIQLLARSERYAELGLFVVHK